MGDSDPPNGRSAGGVRGASEAKEIESSKRRLIDVDMGVSKNGGTPKWMVKIMEIPIKNG